MKRVIIGALVALSLGLSVPASASVIPPRHPGGTHPGTVVPGPVPTSPSQTSRAYLDRADIAIAKAKALDTGNETAFADAWLASAIAHRSPDGWEDEAALKYLHRATAQAHANGGYGLNYAWDAFGDGTVNSAASNYTITYYQVGEPLLEAYAAGAVPASAITSLMDSLFTLTPIPVSPGIGLPYSNQYNDFKPGYVVHNINQGIALLLKDIQAAGITYRKAKADTWINGLLTYEGASYRPDTFDWTYRNGSPQANDPAHNGLGVAMFIVLGDPRGPDALLYEMSRSLGSSSAVAHAYLGQFSCNLSRRWYAEQDSALAGANFQLLAQFARSDILTAQACVPPDHQAPHAH